MIAAGACKRNGYRRPPASMAAAVAFGVVWPFENLKNQAQAPSATTRRAPSGGLGRSAGSCQVR